MHIDGNITKNFARSWHLKMSTSLRNGVHAALNGRKLNSVKLCPPCVEVGHVPQLNDSHARRTFKICQQSTENTTVSNCTLVVCRYSTRYLFHVALWAGASIALIDLSVCWRTLTYSSHSLWVRFVCHKSLFENRIEGFIHAVESESELSQVMYRDAKQVSQTRNCDVSWHDVYLSSTNLRVQCFPRFCLVNVSWCS